MASLYHFVMYGPIPQQSRVKVVSGLGLRPEKAFTEPKFESWNSAIFWHTKYYSNYSQ